MAPLFLVPFQMSGDLLVVEIGRFDHEDSYIYYISEISPAAEWSVIIHSG